MLILILTLATVRPTIVPLPRRQAQTRRMPKRIKTKIEECTVQSWNRIFKMHNTKLDMRPLQHFSPLSLGYNVLQLNDEMDRHEKRCFRQIRDESSAFEAIVNAV